MPQDKQSKSDFNAEELERIWAFVRGDLSGTDFEAWVYTWDQAEERLGPETYLEVLSTNCERPGAAADLKARLRQNLPLPHACKCCTIPNGGSVGTGTWAQNFFVTIEDALDGFAWRSTMKCTACDTTWLVAQEDRIYDEWILERSGGPGLPQTKTYRGLLQAAKDTGVGVDFHDPEKSVILRIAIEDLARETPGIALSDICALLPVPEGTCTKLAEMAILEAKVSINMSG